MNNTERQMWINNHEGLYRWWKASKLSMRDFIKFNRPSIDETIRLALNERKDKYFR